ncbi:MAG: hypothetical protein FWC20_12115 [Oscillospiraceae bacterium]|nr:hypothetical protein [Oscillospiraceae bacterium]MCL2280129.1 hypothetical protein [Oscillospiraceae bacterium]
MAFMDLLIGVSWISVVLFVVGMILVIAEMFQPGFGLFGTFGVLTLIGCIFVTANTVAEGVILTIAITIILLILFFVFLILLSRGKIPGKLILEQAEKKEDGYVGTADYSIFLGKTGLVTTLCRPVGSADFNGKRLEVVTTGEYIEQGASVEVIEVEGNRVVVREVKG